MKLTFFPGTNSFTQSSDTVPIQNFKHDYYFN